MIEVKIFPIYGLAFGINYWDSNMDEEEMQEDETVHVLQIFLSMFGFSIVWYS